MSGFSPFISHSEYPLRSEIVSPLASSVFAFEDPQPITRTDSVMMPAEQGTFQALRLMAAAVRGECPPDFSGYQDEFNYRVAISVVSGLRSKNPSNEIATLFRFVRDNIIYVEHPIGEQIVQDCRRTLELGTGDCVSCSVCLATLLGSIGRISRFVAQHPSAEQAYSHVYLECLDHFGDWIALDPIANGRGGRPLFNVGDRNRLPDGGFETSWNIFE
jgi:transglutaminase-like putative cysteine protease